MTTTKALDVLDGEITARIQSPDFQRWRAMVQASGGCARPIRLIGEGALIGPVGTLIHRHAGELFAPCGNRRASVCESCSARYAADAFHLLRAGLSGGHKHIPTTVTDKPRVFLTLTAPSFGRVHTRRTTPRGNVIPCGCGERHHPDDPRVSSPLDPATYDYVGAVLWQAHAGALWHRFAIALRRALALRLGVPGRMFPRSLGCPTPRSPSTKDAAWSTSTPPCGSTDRLDPLTPHRPASPRQCCGRRSPRPSTASR